MKHTRSLHTAATALALLLVGAGITSASAATPTKTITVNGRALHLASANTPGQASLGVPGHRTALGATAQGIVGGPVGGPIAFIPPYPAAKMKAARPSIPSPLKKPTPTALLPKPAAPKPPVTPPTNPPTTLPDGWYMAQTPNGPVPLPNGWTMPAKGTRVTTPDGITITADGIGVKDNLGYWHHKAPAVPEKPGARWTPAPGGGYFTPKGVWYPHLPTIGHDGCTIIGDQAFGWECPNPLPAGITLGSEYVM